jgi:uncharacterized repeat protein (TIGR01451 family)
MLVIRLFLAIAALVAPSLAQANEAVALDSRVFVERLVRDADGRSRAVLEEPKLVVPGDRLVFILNYRNTGAAPATDFVVTNPMPNAVSFQGTGDPGALVSVDGGRSWGALPALKIRDSDGARRSARPEDVTHVRWAMKRAIPSGSAGKLSFRGIVR